MSALRPPGRSAAGTSWSSCRSSPSRRRPRARASARRRRHRRRSPSTRARPRRRAAARRARAGARRRGQRHRPPRPRRRSRARRPASPGTQKNTAPGVTRRASYARSVTSTAPRAVLSLAASTRVRSSRSTEHHSTAGCRSGRPVAPPPDRAPSRPCYWPVVPAVFVSGASGGTSRYWRSNRAMSLNAGAATLPP